MSEHKKFLDNKLLEELIKDALDEQQVKLTISWPAPYELQGNYEEVMTKLMECVIMFGNVECKLEIIQ